MTDDRTSVDVDLTAQEMAKITSPDAVAALFQRLGYETRTRNVLSPESIGLADSDKVFRNIELISEDEEGFLRIVLAQVRSLTVRARNDLVRSLSRFNQDHLIVMTKDFQVLELVLIDKVKRRQQSPTTVSAYKPIPRVYSFQRKALNRLDLRVLRRLTFTQRDGLEQFDKLRSVFEAAAYTGEYYQNRALFADHYLDTRLRELPMWAESPNVAFSAVKDITANARERFRNKDEATTREGLVKPLFEALGFECEEAKGAADAGPVADYLLKGPDGKLLTAALVYQWDRWLDGPDPTDQNTADENPGASVVSVLERGDAEWVIVTNGRLWRLYSRHAHSRSTNFYEVDLEEIMSASAETDPGEAFRYWWLFFRRQAFEPVTAEQAEVTCWLDSIVAGSRDYAKQVEERLKKRVFEHIVPHLAMGFLHDRKTRLSVTKRPTEEELEEIREGALTLLYRLLFLLYAESRDLLPVRESAYHAASLKKIKEEIAETAGPAETEVDERLASAYGTDQTRLYDRLSRLFEAMDAGDSTLNVPTYNGGLFLTKPDKKDDSREACVCRFLGQHKLPDRFLAQAIDHLSRDPDERSFGLVFIDYKSLGVRQLGSIYEGLLEFKLKIAQEDLTTVKEKGKEKVIPLSKAKGKQNKADIAVRKGDVYLANDKSERRASGSYYTPDHIVEYIVENTVGPVLAAKLEELRPEFRKVEKTYQRHMANLHEAPGLLGGKWDTKAEFETAAKAEATARTYESHKDLVEKAFDLKVLDPAMGSGHFLVEAVDFITDKLLDFLNRFPRNPVSTALERTRQSILESLSEQGTNVDPDKLTDVHLLKRHVLKRCIYGVDLNPMAVELAKVSLWLDAFTLGAPLSFLDHHLRCGNSLIGATFADLEKAREGLMFPLDYEPLHRAINHVLMVARLSDATAAEVHRSADQYAEAYRNLSGYRIVLDILAAQHFGHEKAVDLIQVYGDELNFDNSAALLEAMKSADRLMVQAVETIALEQRFSHWELEFPEMFFGSRPDAEREVERKHTERAGFDAVVGNPPYDVLSSKETGQDVSALKTYLKAQQVYEPSFRGKNNLYKLFICRAIALLRHNGRLGFITPMAILGDDQAADLRKAILDKGAFTAIEAFPQKDDPHLRVFEEAKLSTAVFSIIRTTDEETQAEAFVSRTHPANRICNTSPTLRLTNREIPIYDPENLTIVSCSQADWDLAVRIVSSGRMGRLRQFAEFFQGEVNETVEKEKGNLLPPGQGGHLVTRGACICQYVVRPASQGEDLFVNVTSFLQDKGADTKAFHHKYYRVGLQESCPQNNFRRIIGAMVPSGHFCNHKVNYLPEHTSQQPLEFVLGLLNAKLSDWYFRLGSTNAAVSHYQLYNLPCPVFGDKLTPQDSEVLSRAKAALADAAFEEVYSALTPMIAQPPYGRAVREVIVDLVRRIMNIEASRGQISRPERSSLALAAQPYQDVIDRLFYEMAGLTEEESQALEERLARML